jgi:hypothetical protein
MKKEWHKPKLIRLYSGKPEEAVLAVCKTVGDPTGPLDIDCMALTVACLDSGS